MFVGHAGIPSVNKMRLNKEKEITMKGYSRSPCKNNDIKCILRGSCGSCYSSEFEKCLKRDASQQIGEK